MSEYSEEIIDRLHENSALRDKNNPMRKILDYGIGEWFDRFEEESDFDNFFLDTASGGYLDLWGREFNVQRRPDETDEDYRQRIVLESLGGLTVPYLQEVFGLVLYCFVNDFNPTLNDLTSDNPFACNKYMVIADEDIQRILLKKFVIGSNLTFINGE